jgi:predicted acyl esterase
MKYQTVIGLAMCATAYGFDEPKRHSKSQEFQQPTRDGTYLHTIVYFPGDYEKGKTQKLPAVLDRSPYGYGDMEWITDIFLPFGFAAVGQDMRGTEKSQGNFSLWQLDKDDSTDIGNWIVNQEWSNGEVYTFGASADGLESMQTLKANQDWLKAQYIAWAPAKAYQILMPNGAYKQKTVEDWLLGISMPNPDVVYDNIQTVHEHEAHDDFWENIELSNDDYKNMRGLSGFWGGWYDLFLIGTLQAFDGYNEQSDPAWRHSSIITIDPCGHCLEAAEFFTPNTLQGRTLIVLAQMLQTYGIRPVTRSHAVKNITFYVMSSNDKAGEEAGLYWTSMDSWPKHTMVDYYLHVDKTASKEMQDEGISSYVHNPADPVPTIGGSNLPDSIGGSIPCGPMDQAPLAGRSDVLTFTTEVFTEELAIMGPLFATLFVSSDAVDTDFMVKISDVYPTGEVRILQDNALRMRWREGGLQPVPMTKGDVYQLEINIWNTSYIVAPGHALKFDVASSNFPRFSVNPNNGILLADPAYPGANIIATNSLYHSKEYPSKFALPVVKKWQLPQVDMLKEMKAAYPSITDEMVKKTTAHLQQIERGSRKSK